MRQITLILTLVAFLLLVGSALAMHSDNYRLDWFTPLTGSGGESASSDNYAINFTVGQSVIGASSSTSYEGCLGYWCESGTAIEYNKTYLPLILRN
jgi:hypothetical protein